MVIYEVNLEVEPKIYNDFFLWHQGHMAELISLPGFIKAIAFRDADQPHCISVHYYLDSMEALEHYSEHHASELREEAERNFPGQFKVWRRILTKESVMEA